MAAFQRPFDPALVTAGVTTAVLPDRRDPGATLTHFARYPLLPLRFLTATPAAAGSFAFSWPVTGSARLVDLPAEASAALGVSQLTEVSPFPFSISGVLRALGPGLPVFYVGLGGASLPEQDATVRISDSPLAVTRVVMACVFQDRMVLEPWAWIDLIGSAMEAAAPADAANWRSLGSLFVGQRSWQVRDSAGQPAAGETFTLRFRDSGGAVVRQVAALSDANGDLGPAAQAAAGESTEIVWNPSPLAGDEALPVVTLYEASLADPENDATRSYSGEPALLIPPGTAGGHLQVLDLSRWFAPATQSPGKQWPARVRPRSHVQPLVDGLAAYKLLVEDIRQASGVHMGGWSFEEFPMRPYDPSSSLVSLMELLGRDRFRLLVTKSFQAKEGALDGVGVGGAAALLILMLAMEPLIVTEHLGAFNPQGLLAFHALALLIVAAEVLADPDFSVEEFIRSKAEFTGERTRKLLFDVSGGKPHCAFPAPHPVSLADNPLAHDFSIPGAGALSAVQELWGVYHQKFQIVAKPSGTGLTYVAYLGGMDIRANRVDSPGHHAAQLRQPDSLSAPGPSPYHDVHARVTGPATFDMIGLFQERYDHALTFPGAGIVRDPLYTPPATPPPPAFEPPSEPPPAAGQHLVRIAQTSFRPGPGRVGLPWAPNGDAPIRETFERAIRSAKEYIYIEEQYFTLDDGLIELLRSAADHCRRLVVLVATNTPDQLFGDQRRLATFARLETAWQDRMVAGAPWRRPVLRPAEQAASVGRASLVEDVASNTESKIYVGPPTRVPKSTPYFFWVGGELMYATKAKTGLSPGGTAAVELEVLRGGLSGTRSPWCPHPRPHGKGEPVTFSAPYPIFVHSKLLMVDDLFVAIGSSNWNRRGFYHDGEVDVFAIPDRLKAARDNPAWSLRTALWAEHLGLTPSMGRAVLGDPVEAFELFRRSRYAGNRFCDYREFLAPRGDLTALNNVELFQLLPDSVRTTLLTTANVLVTTQVRNIWNTISDPTSEVDPNPQEGPELP